MEDLIENLKEGVKQRVSGFAGYFVLSWIAWNYKFLIHIFSSGNAQAKIEQINKLYSQGHDYLVAWIIWPTLSTGAVFITFPLIAAVVDLYVHWINAVRDRRKVLIESPLLVTTEELKAFKETLKKSQEQQKILLTEKDQEINELRKLLNESESQNAKLLSSAQELNKRVAILQDINGALSEPELKLICALAESTNLEEEEEQLLKVVGTNQANWNAIIERLTNQLQLISRHGQKFRLLPAGTNAYVRSIEIQNENEIRFLSEDQRLLIHILGDSDDGETSAYLSNVPFGNDCQEILDHLIKRLGLAETDPLSGKHTLTDRGHYYYELLSIKLKREFPVLR